VTHTPQPTDTPEGGVGSQQQTPAEPPASLPDTGSYQGHGRDTMLLLVLALIVLGAGGATAGLIALRRRAG
jgi:hypothetical protein